MGEAQFEKVCKGLNTEIEHLKHKSDTATALNMSSVASRYEKQVVICRDAIALIRQQQERIEELEAAQTARVMTLEDATKSDVCWLEIRDVDRVMPCRIRWYYNSYFIKLFEGAPERFTEAEYGTGLRCWTKRPTFEQREATPWG